MSYSRVFLCILVGIGIGIGKSCFSAGVFESTANKTSEDDTYVEKKIVEGWEATEEKFLDGWHIFKSKTEQEWANTENEVNVVVKKVENACSCFNYNCGCCSHLEEPTIHLNSTICTNVTYLVEDYGISWTVTVNNYAIYNETISVRNPPPVCLGVPYVKELADACVRLYDIDATTTHLHACVRVEARMKKVLIAKYDLGCFDIGPTVKKEQRDLILLKWKERMEEVQENIYTNVTGPLIGLVVVLALLLCVVTWYLRRNASRGLIERNNYKNKGYGTLEPSSSEEYPKC